MTLGFTYFGYLFYVKFCAKNDGLSSKLKTAKYLCQTISIVIPTYNEERVIAKKLANTMNLFDNRDPVEIIVADDGSTDDTIRIIESLKKNFKNKIVLISHHKHEGKASVINAACKNAKGEIIVITDADVFLPKESFLSLISNFSDLDVGAVCGREIIVNPNDNFITRAEHNYRNFFHSRVNSEKKTDFPPIPFHGGLMAIRKQLYTDLPVDVIGDDHEIALRVWRKGYRVIYDPNSIFWEYATQSLSEIYESKKRRAYGVIQSLLTNRDLLFNKKAGGFGMVRFPILALEFLICPFAFFLGLTSLLFHIILTGDFMLVIFLIVMLLLIFAAIRPKEKGSLKDIFYMIFGVFIFQAAIAHAVLETLFGISKINWKKIEGQRPENDSLCLR